MSEALERDLARAGIAARVEVRDRLALLIPRDADAGLTSDAQRRVALALAAEAGFTHVALELLD
ncbi:MAG: hypothetical protein ACRENH_01600 [Gemmatimonadaceae bacterium]